MCGICGIVGFDPSSQDPIASERVQGMLGRLSHRGPDETRWVAAPGAVLGATRLAIRGLVSGSQPLADSGVELVAVCNGEIDNHRELRAWLEARGRSVDLATDVAVLPGLYRECGPSFVERLTGAFALAIWDAPARRLILARDRAGERPLFFTRKDGRIQFASEIAALAAAHGSALEPDRQALARYLRFGCFVSPSSPFRGIERVGPGETIVFEDGQAHRARYWRLPIVTSPKTEPSEERFDGLLRGAVRLQSDVEVPCGVFLSGGVDSSLIAAIARRERGAPLPAFTVRFQEPSYDEGDPAAQVAALLGGPLESVWARAEEFPERIARLVAQSGEPLADPAWVPAALLASRAAEQVKVVLVGEGADELFGGYPTYIGASMADRYRKLPLFARRAVAALVHAWPTTDKKVAISFLLKRFVDGAELEGLARHRLWTSVVPPQLVGRLVTRLAASWSGTHSNDSWPRFAEFPQSVEDHSDAETSGELLDIVQRYDLETSLAEGLLTKSDRAGMSSGLELRAPFLDRDVMEFAATIPPRARVRGVTTKVFLKQFALRYLPPSIVHRRKRGLSVPLARWLRGPLLPWAEARLGSARLGNLGLDPREALVILEEHRSGRADHARALWALAVLSEWLDWAARVRRAGAAAPGPPIL